MKKRVAFFVLLMAVCLIFPTTTKAATLKAPKVNKNSAYMNNTVFLKWGKVKGAKKYEIQRSKVNTKKAGKVGKWKKWAVTKKTSIKKKGAGDYKYRIRAIKGKKKGKWSKAKRIFGARAQITNIIYEKPEYIWGIYCEGTLNFRILVDNRTQSQMGFVKYNAQGTIYAMNAKSNKVLKSWPAHLYIAESNGYAKQINPHKKNSIYVYCSMDEDTYAKYKGCKFMVTESFYPNPYVEPISTQMAIACTKSLKESAIAGK